MPSPTRHMRLLPAALSAALLLIGSSALLLLAAAPTDAAAIAGGVGAVMAGALFGMTILVWRWRGASVAYTRTFIVDGALYEKLEEQSEAVRSLDPDVAAS